MLVAKLSSNDSTVRRNGIRGAAKFLSDAKRDLGTNEVPNHSDRLSRVERFEASTLPSRLYSRLFSPDEVEAREAAYALVANASVSAGRLDPALSPNDLTDVQQEQFRSALVGFLAEVNLHYFSHVTAVSCDSLDAGRLGVRLRVVITRRVPFRIGGRDVMLRGRDIRGKLHIDCPWAEAVDAGPPEAVPGPDEAIVAAGDAYVVLKVGQDSASTIPVVVSFDRAIETVDVPLPAPTRG